MLTHSLISAKWKQVKVKMTMMIMKMIAVRMAMLTCSLISAKGKQVKVKMTMRR